MRSDLTELCVLVDRSGSMSVCQEQAQAGLNKFIEEQKSLSGEANLTLVLFDTEYEFLYKGTPIKDVLQVALVPRGGTALLDAIGRAINETGERLSKMDEKDRPGLVVFVILTDGEENSSKEFTAEKIKEMIEHQKNVYKWVFTYLGANQDAFKVAAKYGIGAASSANFNTQKTSAGFAATSGYVMRARGLSAQGLEVEEKTCGYTPEERKSMTGK